MTECTQTPMLSAVPSGTGMLADARALSERGFYVFPCRGKVPALAGARGHLDATDDPARVEELWTTHCGANIGVACTEASGLLVVDVDPRNGGLETIKRLLVDAPNDLDKTLVSDTPGGGFHMYFRHPGGALRAHLGAGVDIKHNGYVIAPPSLGSNGRLYAWVDPSMPISDPPDWLVELMRREDQALEPAEHRLDVAAAVAGVPQGERDETLFRLACKLRRADLPRTLAERLLLEAAAACDPPFPAEAALAKVASAWKYHPGNGAGAEVPNQDRRPLVGPVLVRMSDVERKDVTWLWRHRIPRGKLTGCEGDPGLGKSWMLLAVAAAVTTATLLPDDDQERQPQDVLLLTAEDGVEDTVQPRLADMGADLTRVVQLRGVIDSRGREHFPSLSQDLLAVESAIRGGDFGLVIIDPINAYLGGTDGSSDVDVRSVLGPLSQLADTYGVAVVFVRHLTKSARDRSIYRGLGSIGYTAAARSVLLVGVDPEDERRRVIACHKHNLAPEAPSIAFELEGRFHWRGTSHVNADALLATASADARSALEEAAEFLRAALAGGPRSCSDVHAEAEQLGISQRTLKRARSAIGAASHRVGGAGAGAHWEWSLD